MDDETCDSCCQRPTHHAERGTSILRFCDHHAREHGPALTARGWTVTSLAEPVAHA